MDEDRLIAEALGLCWHEWEIDDSQNHPFVTPRYMCRCGEVVYSNFPSIAKPNTNFSTPEGFFKIMELGPKQEWWHFFMISISAGVTYRTIKPNYYYIWTEFINPPKMKARLAQFLRKEK